MALDNVELDNLQAGDDVATDLIATDHYQIVKLAYGPLGTATVVDSITTNPFPVQLSATDNAVLDTIAGAVSGTEMQVDIVSGNVTNAGTFAVQVDGDALTSLQLLDDAIQTDDAAYTLGTGKGVMIMGFAGTQSVNANDAAALACDTDGALHISDGGNSITIDGTITADAGSGTFTVDSELPAAAALADNASNPTAPAVGAFGMVWDGATWDRLPGTSADGLTVNLGTNNDVGINAGTNMIGRIEQNVSVSATGTSTFYDEDLDETAIAVDAGAVNIYSIQAFNTTAAPLFLQLFNIAAGSVTVGTTKPTNQYVIPGNADSDGAGFMLTFSVPKSYGTALTAACTTGSETAGAPGAGACIVNIEYAT